MSNNIPEDLRYTEEHEWIRVEGNEGTCGLTDHAQQELTDIVFVELPETDREVAAGEQVCVVESVKSVSDVYSPVSGKITAINTNLEDSPELINSSPYDQGWIFKIELKDTAELDSLMDNEAYEDFSG